MFTIRLISLSYHHCKEREILRYALYNCMLYRPFGLLMAI
jgi:hypothetical protein